MKKAESKPTMTRFDTEEGMRIQSTEFNGDLNKDNVANYEDENEEEYEEEYEEDSDEFFYDDEEPESFDYDEKSSLEAEVQSLAGRWIRYLMYLLLGSYIGAVIIIDYERGILVLILAFLGIAYNIMAVLAEKFPESFNNFEQSMINFMDRADSEFKVGGPIIIMILIIMVILALFVVRDMRNLRSLVGIVVFLFISYLFSHKRSAVRWRPVIGAFFTQYIFGFVVIRTDWGREAIQYVAMKTSLLLDYTKVGSSFVYGYLLDESLKENPVQLVNGSSYFFGPSLYFESLQTIIFFSSLISVLYYLNLIQIVVKTLGKLDETLPISSDRICH